MIIVSNAGTSTELDRFAPLNHIPQVQLCLPVERPFTNILLPATPVSTLAILLVVETPPFLNTLFTSVLIRPSVV